MSFFAGSYGRSWTGRTRRSAEVGDLGIELREETFLAAFIVDELNDNVGFINISR